jgi:hypothetical protein
MREDIEAEEIGMKVAMEYSFLKQIFIYPEV